MSDNLTLPDHNNSTVCEAIGCYSIATNTIALSVGPKRTISLLVCSNCKAKLHFESSRKDVSTLTSCWKRDE
jgi:hypothetical protein